MVSLQWDRDTDDDSVDSWRHMGNSIQHYNLTLFSPQAHNQESKPKSTNYFNYTENYTVTTNHICKILKQFLMAL